eukprot:904445-Prorocentrum_minimum.AAC.1
MCDAHLAQLQGALKALEGGPRLHLWRPPSLVRPWRAPCAPSGRRPMGCLRIDPPRGCPPPAPSASSGPPSGFRVWGFNAGWATMTTWKTRTATAGATF